MNGLGSGLRTQQRYDEGANDMARSVRSATNRADGRSRCGGDARFNEPACSTVSTTTGFRDGIMLEANASINAALRAQSPLEERLVTGAAVSQHRALRHREFHDDHVLRRVGGKIPTIRIVAPRT